MYILINLLYFFKGKYGVMVRVLVLVLKDKELSYSFVFNCRILVKLYDYRGFDFFIGGRV